MAEVKNKVVSVEVLKAAYEDLKDKISLETLGITATADELNQLGGQESPIKQQFDQLTSDINDLSENVQKVENDVADVMAGKGSGCACVVLSATNWIENMQSVTVNGITDRNTVITSPAPEFIDEYVEYNIKCIEQKDGELKFSCSDTPMSDIYINVLILNIDSSGLQHFVLTAYTNPGAEVSITNDQKTLKKIADHKGGASFIVSPGVWSITAVYDGLLSSGQISVVGDAIYDILINMIPSFSYTGAYELVDDEDNPITYSQDNWKIRFLTSGVLKFNALNGASDGIDVFCVGGGSGGNNYACAAGGGGGYTVTELNKTITIDTEYNIVVGDGGLGATEHQAMGGSGGETSAFGVVALGAENPVRHYPGYTNGGNGGSGGGSGGIVISAEDLYVSNGSGGKDGGNGEGTYPGTLFFLWLQIRKRLSPGWTRLSMMRWTKCVKFSKRTLRTPHWLCNTILC